MQIFFSNLRYILKIIKEITQEVDIRNLVFHENFNYLKCLSINTQFAG